MEIDMTRTTLLLALSGLAFACSAADLPDAPKTTDRVLAAMDRTPTEGHPDQYNEFAGMHRYVAGDYAGAMKHFLASARYADKLSQLSIGLMYLNGEGVAKDPVTAFAWIALAAERKYPQFLVTRDRVWASLDAAQREQATAKIAALYTEYGDPVAKRRMANALHLALMEETGSGLGYDKSGTIAIMRADGIAPNCGGETIEGAPTIGCGDIYADWRWNAKDYFQTRDATWTGTVTVGALQNADKPAPNATNDAGTAPRTQP
jgi:uncharacterized protein